MISCKPSFGNQQSIMIELLCQQSHLPQIKSLVSIYLKVNMAHMQYHLRALQIEISCKICQSAFNLYWVIMLKNMSGT